MNEPLLGPWMAKGRRHADERPAVLAGNGELVTWAWRKQWHPVLISPEDEWICHRNLYLAASGYVVLNLHGKQRLLHRVIEWVRRNPDKDPMVKGTLAGFWLSTALQVDHDDRCLINNRRDNLSLVDTTLNTWNHAPTNEALGVSWDKNRERWIAKVKYQGKTHNVGRFRSERQAARAVDRKRAALAREHLKALAGALGSATTPF
jgi:hypothetical protein